jgi:two-component system LytT family response regulator
MSLNIVYLDDEPELCEMFLDFFTSVNVSIKTFTDPQTAIDSINANPPDLIFLDYRLPNTNGDQVALKLSKSIPKVLVTGDITINTEYSFLKVFPKPYKHEEMESFISGFKKT